MKKEKKEVVDYLADITLWILGGVMFIYLGFRTLDFLTFTFREEDVIFAYLGLFSTTVGSIIFALIYKRSFYFDRKAQVWRSDEFRKMVSMSMMFVCAVGELLIAVADMTIIADIKAGTAMMTEGDLKSIMWLTAGLAGAVGAAVAAIKLTPRHPKTDPEIDMSLIDADNNGVEDAKEKPSKGGGQQERSQPPQNQPMHSNAADAELVQLREENARLKAQQNPNSPAGKS